MFGYVNIFKDELKIKEYNVYRSYYCGLCKKLGKEFSQSVRMGLSYDFSFLALLLSSVESEKEDIKEEKCIIHHMSKRPVNKEDKYISYSAYMSVITTYFKLKDDVNDEFKIKSLLSLLFYKKHLKKCRKKYPSEFKKIEENLKILNNLEKEKCSDIDKVAHPFAEILSMIFTPSFLECDEISKKALKKFGYDLGRFIYIADAVNDIEKDKKKKNYNPLIFRDSENLTESIDFSLTFTLSNIARAFDLIEFKKNKNIIENIVYLGLRNSKDRALKGMVK